MTWSAFGLALAGGGFLATGLGLAHFWQKRLATTPTSTGATLLSVSAMLACLAVGVMFAATSVSAVVSN